MDREQERERMKEEYKEHFRKMRETREKVKEAVGYQKITQALNNMNADDIFNSMGEMVDSLKEKVAVAEAKLEMALESYKEVDEEPAATTPTSPTEPKLDAKARQALQQIKLEMGLVYKDLEKEAEGLREGQKTMGRQTSVEPSGSDVVQPDAPKKTIGKSSDL